MGRSVITIRIARRYQKQLIPDRLTSNLPGSSPPNDTLLSRFFLHLCCVPLHEHRRCMIRALFLRVPARQRVCAAMSSDSVLSSLRAKTCVGQCSRATPLVDASEVQSLLSAVPNWRLEQSGSAHSRTSLDASF